MAITPGFLRVALQPDGRSQRPRTLALRPGAEIVLD